MIYSPSIEILFKKDSSIEQQLTAVKTAGFDAYEFWGWRGKPLDEMAELQEKLGLRAASFCISGGSMNHPEERQAFLEGVVQSLEAASQLNCKHLIGIVGNELPDYSREQQQEAVVTALGTAAPLLEKAGVTLVLEPLNVLINHPGYYLSSSAQAFEIIRLVNSPNIKVLFDIYHQQITEGNLINNITSNIDQIGYFHVADHPGRHEPGTGEINYHNVLRAIEAAGYDGYIGLEYSPTTEVLSSLKQVAAQYRSKA